MQPGWAFIAAVADSYEGKSASARVAHDHVVPMLLGIAVATITLVAACVVSLVLRPDPELLRPIDRHASRSASDPQPDDDCTSCGEGTAQSMPSTSHEGGP